MQRDMNGQDRICPSRWLRDIAGPLDEWVWETYGHTVMEGSSISPVRLLRDRESNGQEQEDDDLRASSLTEISHDKKDVM